MNLQKPITFFNTGEEMLKTIQYLSTGAMIIFLAACGSSAPKSTTVKSETPAKPALGTWGVDMTAQKASIKPGDDFFSYTNGTWLDTFELPADRDNYGSFSILSDRSRDQIQNIIDDLKKGSFEEGSVEQKISDYYNSYMDTEAIDALGIDPIRPLLSEIAAATTLADITILFGRAPKENLSSPITLNVGINRQNPDLYQASMGVGGMGLPDRDYYLTDDEHFKGIRDAYIAHIAEMLSFAGIPEADEKAKTVLAVETRIAEKQWPRSERRNRDKTLNPMDYVDFKAAYKGLDWDAFLKARDMGSLRDLNVSYPDAVAAVVTIINEVPVEDWRAYLSYKAITNNASLLSQEIDNANFNFFGKTLQGTPEQEERWKRAIDRVGALNGLGEAIGQVYVERYFPESSKKQMVELVQNLHKAFDERIGELEWMSDATKAEARKKLSTFNPKIGYPNKWKDLSGITIRKGDLFGNAKSLDLYNHADRVDRLTRKTDKDEWFMPPQQVNAYYNSQFNEIVFPAAILQPPFFDPNADLAVNYGGIGAVIGHEMGHGFDDQGSKSDDKGVQRNWWSDADREAFEKRTDVLVAQYNTYEALPGNFVDGKFTLGENIGDVGGLAIAYHAYKLALAGKEAPVIDGLSGDQRFFLAWAQVWQRKYRDDALISRLKSDPHSPSKYRVNGVVRNMDQWYEAFHITEGDALYLPPEQRVSIW